MKTQTQLVGYKEFKILKEKSELKTGFLATGSNVSEVIEIKPGVYALTQYVIRMKDMPLFENRFDALYHNFKTKVQSGKKQLENYRSSPYFKDYCARFKVDAPEFFI